MENRKLKSSRKCICSNEREDDIWQKKSSFIKEEDYYLLNIFMTFQKNLYEKFKFNDVKKNNKFKFNCVLLNGHTYKNQLKQYIFKSKYN